MNNKSDIQALFAGLIKPRHISYEKRLVYPVRDWFIGLGFFFAIVLLGGAYSAHQFVTYRTMNVTETSLTETTVTYNQMLVTRVLEDYYARSVIFNELRQTPFQQVVLPESHSSSTLIIEGGDASTTTLSALSELSGASSTFDTALEE
jgi:hypothetical protein